MSWMACYFLLPCRVSFVVRRGGCHHGQLIYFQVFGYVGGKLCLGSKGCRLKISVGRGLSFSFLGIL